MRCESGWLRASPGPGTEREPRGAPVILIVSWPEDGHAQAVLAALDSVGESATMIDLAQFPQEIGVAIRYEGGRRRYRLRTREGEVPLDRCRAIWWRRPRPFVLHPEIADGPHATFAYSESTEAFAGLWQSLDVAWINHPAAEETAARKVYQLRTAQDVGLEIPRTLITNDPAEARAFIDVLGHELTVYKAFLPTADDWRETRILRLEEVSQIESVRYAPVIFQEYVPAGVDLRVTVVGDEILAAAIHSQQTSYQVDYRMDLGRARVEPFQLTQGIRDRVHALMTRLGLVYGAVDMRLTPDGRHVFLEINPSGEWLFVEERTGLPITETFARLLAARARGRELVSEGPARPG